MKNTMYIGSTAPYGEDGVQLGSENYYNRAAREGLRFLDQIRKHYGDEPGLSYLDIKSNPHDFGTYLSIEYYYDDESEAHTKYALDIEGDVKGVLEYWDPAVMDPGPNEMEKAAKYWGIEDWDYDAV